MDAATQLKYRPNHSARSLTTSHSNLIAVAITDLDNQFYPQLVQQLSDKLATYGYRVMLFLTYGEENLDPVLEEILSYRVDGVILASSSHAIPVAKECKEAHIPVLMLNNIDTEHSVSSITTNNEHGATSIAAYLMAAGHQSFGLISGSPNSSTGVIRSRVFREAILAAGYSAPLEEAGNYRFDEAMMAARKLLSHSQPPDAIFCANDHMALATLQIARDEFGLIPGKDVSIVGFDDVSISQWPAFDLTTFAQPLDKMVDLTVDHLLRAILQGDENVYSTELKGQLIVRGSTRRAPGIQTGSDGQETWSI